MFDIEKLNEFYTALSAADGMSISDSQDRLATLFAKERSKDDLNDYRLGRGSWKKLRDEIVPVSHFLQFQHIESGWIRFPLDNSTPDCWLSNDDGDSFGIEVTIERGREQYHLKKEMIEAGQGRGFIGIQDDAPQSTFNDRMSNPRVMYSSEQALDAVKAGIIRCLSRKNDADKYKGVFYLLIEAGLRSLPKERWSTITEELAQESTNLPFQEIHIIGDADSEPWGFQIK